MEVIIKDKNEKNHSKENSNFTLTLTRPIGLPSYTPVAQKIAGQRWLIANLAKK